MANQYTDSAAKENIELNRDSQLIPSHLEDGNVKDGESEKTQVPLANPNLVCDHL